MDKDKYHQLVERAFLFLGCIPILIGGYWLIAWLGGWANEWSVQGAATGKIIMKTNNALCQLLSGLTIILIGLKENNTRVRIIASVFAAVVFIIGAMTLSEHIFHKNLGIDQLLATEMPGAAATLSPNRMGQIASLSFLLLGAGLLFMIWDHRLIASYLGATVCIVILVPAVGYILEIGTFFSMPKLTYIAWPTIVALFTIGLALVFSSRKKGFIPGLLREDPGGELIRRLFPAIIVVPLVLGFVILHAQRLKIYNQITGFGTLIIATILLLLLLASLTARSLNRANSKKQLVELELKESEKNYRELIKYAPAGIYNVDFRSEKFTSVNDAMCQSTGYSRDELLSMSPFQLLDDAGKKAFQRRISNWLAGEKPDENVEYRVTAKDGHIIYSLLNVRLNVDNKGIPIAATVIAHDITERKKYENEIESLSKFPSENPWPVLRLSNEAQILYSNEAAREILSKWGTFTGDKVPSEIELIIRETLSKGSSGTFEIENNDKIILFHCVPVLGKDYVNVYGMDITRRKQVEIKLDVALENANIGTWEWNIKTNEVAWDIRTEKMFGLEPGEFGETYKSFEDFVNEEDITRIRKSLKDTIENNLPFETIYRINLKTGSTRYISSKGHLIKDTEGKPLKVSGVCSDITDLIENNEKLISKINEELLRSNKELENFAYVASHDLQEPLRMVTSFTQLLAKQYKENLDGRAMEYIDFAVEGSKRMYELLNGLLTYSRISTRGNELKKIELTGVFNCAIKNLALLIKEKQVVISADELPVIMGDANQMIQLFQNLIANSIKFTPESPIINISSMENRDHYIISVKDNGIGIESQYYDRIFQIFQRLNPRDKYEGTGIGLSICKRIVERHGGKIWLESIPGKGSTFHFTIPKNSF
jgi:PAS domain S-box-containing protein